MVEFTPEVIEMVKARFESVDIEMSEVKDRLTTIYEQPFMAKFTDETKRQKAATKVLFAQVLNQLNKKNNSKSETLLMRIEGKEEVTPFKRQDGNESYRSNLYVTVMDEGEAKFGMVTLWGDANEMHPSLIIGKTYLIPAVVGSRDPITMAVNDAVDIDVSDEVISESFDDIITKDFSPVDIKDMEFNISRDWNDPKLVTGTVVSAWMKITKNDKNMGFLKIVGDDSEEITVVKFSKSPDQVVMYGAGSMVYVLGQITAAVMGDDGLEKFPVGMWGNLIAPMLVVPPEDMDTPGIETSETPIQKPSGETQGFTEDAVEGW